LNRTAAIALIGGALALIVVAVMVLRPAPELASDPQPTPPPESLPPVEPGEGVLARLYFPGDDERLHQVERELPLEGPLEDRARVLLLALLEGPEAAQPDLVDELSPALPEGMAVRHVFRPEPALLLVDLEPPASPAALAMGSRQELLVVYSVVNTLVLNLDGIERVALLLAGVQRPTFAGHVDTTRPLAADRRLISFSASPSG
jgi:hypothetical protein